MRIESEKAKRFFRGQGRCEVCGVACQREAAHIFGVGAGRVDHPINLVGIGGFPCHCHSRSHNGNGPTRKKLLTISGAREGWSIEAIVDVINATRRADRDAPHILSHGAFLCGHERLRDRSVPIDEPENAGCPLCKAVLLRSESKKPIPF